MAKFKFRKGRRTREEWRILDAIYASERLDAVDALLGRVGNMYHEGKLSAAQHTELCASICYKAQHILAREYAAERKKSAF